MPLQLEVKETPDATAVFEGVHSYVLVTPPIDEDYWVFRVRVSEDQAVLGFSKFGMIGVGFAKEEDWNTNLPADCPTSQIWSHIQCNAAGADEATCIEAIKIIQRAAARFQGKEIAECERGGVCSGRYAEELI